MHALQLSINNIRAYVQYKLQRRCDFVNNPIDNSNGTIMKDCHDPEIIPTAGQEASSSCSTFLPGLSLEADVEKRKKTEEHVIMKMEK